ncbi:MAG: hypothetical protein EGR35_11235 [Collinsella aerofaciens]|nr:hypothetical protein [Collinsella aerofaciens]
MYRTRKIGVAGQGHVGAHVANSLLMQGIADELYLCDINEAKVTSEVQDLRDSLSFVPYNTKIVNCYDHYEELACCDVIVNAAGKNGQVKPAIAIVATFLTTFVSGVIFMVIKMAMLGVVGELAAAMLPVVAMTAVFNAILVGALYLPIQKALKLN